MQPPSRRPLEAVIRDQDGRQIARCLIQRGRYVIGQDWKNEIIVDHPTVSVKHARLTVETETSFFIEDLESANGTTVDGQPTEGAVAISLDNRVELGGTILEFQRCGLPAAVFELLPEAFLRKNRYNMGEIVVQGSTSTIIEAYDTSLCRSLAIKVMRPESQCRLENVLRFVREAQISSQIQHPGVLPIYELNLDPQSQLFYTTRFVEGDSLATILDAVAATPPSTVPPHTLRSLLLIFGKVCDTLAFAHSLGVIHCCLRPECISVGAYGEVFVNQWGLAKVTDVDANGEPLRAPLNVAPTNAWPAVSPFTAPEVATEAIEEVSARSDIYALGAILYRILTLSDPMTPTEERGILEMVLSNSIKPISSFKEALPHYPGGNIPETLASLATRAMSYKPEDRPLSVSRFRHEITSFENGTPAGEPGLWKHFSGLLGAARN
ncbi:MAG: hypothetical protein JWL59_4573 [Chthoniobacteraceae bacterium]|nr:hypothetical protein [Chthoniobacteraceae bacterium]